MPSPLDSLTLPKNVTALWTLLLNREAEHTAELEAARNGLKEQALQIEQLKARLAKLLRQRFGSSSEKIERRDRSARTDHRRSRGRDRRDNGVRTGA